MKKAVITFSIATMLAGGLVGCGIGQQAGDGTARDLGVRNTQLGRTAPYGDTMVPRTGVTNQFAGTTRAQDITNLNTGLAGARGTQQETGLGTRAGNVTGLGEDNQTQDRRFTDVGPGNTHFADIEWATEQGIFRGVGANEFAPNQALTRAQASTLLKRMADQGYINVPTEDETPDEAAEDDTVIGDEDITTDDTTPDEGVTTDDTTPDEDAAGEATTD